MLLVLVSVSIVRDAPSQVTADLDMGETEGAASKVVLALDGPHQRQFSVLSKSILSSPGVTV